jgi:hypothetical protein
MAIYIGGKLCQELVADYREGYDIMQGPSAQKKYLCNWADRFAVAHGFLGLSSVPLPGGLISLNLPLPFPELAQEATSSLASMYAKTVEIEGVGTPYQGQYNIAFTSAIVTVTFGNFPWTFQGIDYFQLDQGQAGGPPNPTPYVYAEQHISRAGEWITVPGKNVYVNPGGAPTHLDQDWGFWNPLADLSITLKQVPYLPSGVAMLALQNPICSIPYLGAAAGKLILKGADDDRTKSSDGTQTCDWTLSFGYRPIAPWDYVYYRGSWLQVTDGAGAPIMGRSDLSQLIPSNFIA